MSAGGCLSEVTTAVATVNALPTVTASAANSAVCEGNSTTLTAGGASTYVWSTNETGAEITVTPAATTTYTVTGEDANHCTNTASVTVTVNPVPGVPTVTSTTVCKGSGNETLSATQGENGTTLRWRTTPTGTPTPQATYLATTTGTYYVSTYNATTECESDQVTITVVNKPSVTITAANSAVCEGNTTTLTADGASTYSWSNDETGAEITVTPAASTTTYTVTGTDANNCTNTASVTVTVNTLPAAPTVTATSVYACGGAVTLEATPATGTTLNWYAADGTLAGTGNTLSLTGIAAVTTYSAKSYNSTTGCESAATEITVTPATAPTTPTISNVERCGAGEVIFTLPTTDNISYKWYTNNNSYITTTTGDYTVNVTTTTTYKVASYNMETNCEGEKVTVTATVNALPTVTATAANSAVCESNSTTLTAGGASTYVWSTNETDATITVTPAATTTYTVTGTDANGCDNTATVTVTVNPVPGVPTVTPVADQCLTGSYVQVSLQATAGEGGSYAQWYDNNMTAQTQNTYGVRPATTTTYYVATVGTNGCISDTIPVQVVVNPRPDMPTVAAQTRCGAGEVTFTLAAADNIQYKWYDANDTYITTTDSNYTVQVSANTTTFKVAAYNTVTGCESDKVTTTATVNTLPAAPQVTPITNCGPTTVTLTATSNNTLTWYAADQTTELTTTTQEVATTTSFYVMATDQNQCHSALQELVVTINEIPAAPTVATPDAICGEGSAVLTATPAEGCAIQWYNAGQQFLAAGNTYETPVINASTSYKATNKNTTTECESQPTTVEVVVNTLPAAPVLTAEPICGAGNATLTAAEVTGETTHWYADAAMTQSIGEGATVSVPVTTTTVFYAKNVNNTTSCESAVANVTAVVYPTYNNEVAAVACAQYEWNNETFTASGDYTRTLHTVNNCDSVVTLHLTINPILNTEITVDECDSWTWNNQTITESGDYTQTLTAVTNCDSIVTAHVTIRHSTASQQQLTLCSNELPYTFAGTQITSAGVKTITIDNAQGCDSVITLTVTVNPQPLVPEVTNASRCGAGDVILHASFGTNGTVCRWYADETATEPIATGASYTAENLTETTTYYVSSYNANTGCESGRLPVTATINEVPAQPVIENVARCGAGSVTMTVDPADNTMTYRWYSNNTTTTSLYEGAEYTITNLSATTNFFVEAYNAATTCKSARKQVTATMNAIPPAPVTTNTENCGADVFALQNMVTSTPNTTFRWYEDATVTTPLATANTYNTETVSASRSFFVSNYNETTTCESPRSEIQITIHPTYEPVTLTDVVCQGTTYTAHGQNTTYNEAGEYTVVLSQTSSHGCDSVVTLVITVNPTSAAAYQAQVCAGEQYQGYGFDTTAAVAGTYTLMHHNTNVLGCDSVTTLTLTVNPVKATTINTTICATASYSFNGQTLTEPGTYTANLQTVNGCDSIVTLNLSVAAEYRDTIVAHICEGASYTQNGFNANATGFYTQDLIATNGCDSVVVLNLTVHQLNTTNLTAEICEGESYTANGFNVTPAEDGVFTYQQVVQTSYGCDSTVNLTLTVNPVYHYSEIATICSDEAPYAWHGQSLTTSGIYHDNLQSVHGCDSTYTLNLTVLPAYHQTINVTLCDNSDQLPYMFAGEALTTSGQYTHTFQTINGCDSIIDLNLTINPTYSQNQTVEICDNELPYVWNNRPEFTYHQAGEYTINLQTAAGCDSIYHLTLIVHPTYEKDTIITICQGALPYIFDAQHTFNEAGNYDVTLASQYGCDSIWHVQFRVLPYAHRTEAVTICADALPYVYDADHSFDAAGVYDIMEEQADGCNTIVTLTLTVNPTYLHYDTVTACANTLPYIYDGMTMATAGTYTKSYQTVNGCDSTVMVTLHVTENPTGTETVHVCSDAFPYSYAGQSYAAAGTYEVVFTTAGCDSIVTLTIIEAPLFHAVENVETCENALPYLWHGQSLTANGQYTDNHQSIYGCDSTYTLNLVISDVKRSTEQVDLCEGETYSWHGMTLSQTGNYADTLQSLSGCDSICQLVVTVHPNYSFETTVTTCQSGLPYHLDIADTMLNVSTAGTSTFIFNRTSVYGCDSITTVTLVVNPVYTFSESVSVCAYDLPYSWRGQTLNATGTYYDSLQTVNGCDSVYALQFTVLPSNVTVSAPIEICEGETATWRNLQITETGHYRDSVMNAAGCYDYFEVDVEVHPTYLFTETVTICDDELPYQWRNRTLTSAGTYDANYQTVTFCDSVYRLVLVVNPSYDFTETMTLCADETPYSWHGQSLAATGVYYDSLQTVNGCDSTYTLTLTVNPTYSFAEAATICSDEAPYSWHGQSLTTTGVYTDSLLTANGCDSVYTLTLTVNPSYHFDETESVCSFNLPYVWHGQSLNVTGVYYDSLQTVNGCDSIYTLNLTVTSIIEITQPTIELCEGMTQTWRGQIVATTGEYRDTVMNAQGCYDIYVVNAVVYPTYHYYDTMTVCQSELPYVWGGHTFNAAETYTLNLQTVNGCDSIREYTLVVNPTYSFAETETLCADAVPYSWHGQSLTTTGVYTDSLLTVNGCDSVYTLTLTVNPTYSFAETSTICASEAPYSWHGQNLSATGVYTDSLQTATGCDSVYTLTLTVNPTYSFAETASVCSYDLPYSWRGQELAATGTYYDSLSTVNGCDSVYALTLTVNQSQIFTQPVIELCEGMTQTWRGQTIAATGEYRDTVMNAQNCYDIYVVNAVVNPTYHFYDTMTVCQSELPYVWGGHTFNAAETYTLNLQTVNGCDSIREYTLVVNPTYSFAETETLCADAVPYIWHGQSLTTTGVYTDSLLTVNGCDSVYTLTLTVNPTYSFAETATICASEAPYSWHGQNLSATGVYTDSLQTATGCDSVYTLTLTVNPTYSFAETASVCSYDLPYSWRGQELAATGTYYDSLSTVNGCDSVYALTLTVNQSQVFTQPVIELCEGMTQTWRGQTIAATGEYRDTVMNAQNCYDIYVVNAVVYPTYHYYDTMTVCQSELPYVWGGHTFNAAETYTLNLQTVNGCDSIREYTLLVNPTYSFAETETLCADAVPYSWHGQSLTTTGVYTDSLLTVNGCDSVYTLTLTVNPVNHTYDTAVVCSNELPYVWRGQQLNASGHYTDAVPNSYGCSDIFELQLTVNQTQQTTIYDTICQGEHYAQYGFDTIPATYGTFQLQSLHTSTMGCDSTVILLLTVNRTYLFTTEAATCENVPYEWRGNMFDSAGVYYETFQTVNGCDSIYMLSLSINPTYEIFVQDTAVRQHEYVGYGLTLMPLDSGVFEYDIQNYTIDGCDSVIHLTLYVQYNDGVQQYVQQEPSFNLYPNPATTYVNIDGEGMERVYVYNALGKLMMVSEADSDTHTRLEFVNYPVGYYIVKIQLSDGRSVQKKVVIRR